MNLRQIKRQLKAVGFVLEKRSQHEVYRKGEFVLTLGRGSRCGYEMIAEARKVLKRAHQASLALQQIPG